MIAVASPPERRRPPLLETGDILGARDFLSRWEQMPNLKNAELIEGVVYITGLWLSLPALLRQDGRELIATLGLADPTHAAFVAKLAARKIGS